MIDNTQERDLLQNGRKINRWKEGEKEEGTKKVLGCEIYRYQAPMKNAIIYYKHTVIKIEIEKKLIFFSVLSILITIILDDSFSSQRFILYVTVYLYMFLPICRLNTPPSSPTTFLSKAVASPSVSHIHSCSSLWPG